MMLTWSRITVLFCHLATWVLFADTHFFREHWALFLSCHWTLIKKKKRNMESTKDHLYKVWGLCNKEECWNKIYFHLHPSGVQWFPPEILSDLIHPPFLLSWAPSRVCYVSQQHDLKQRMRGTGHVGWGLDP